MCCSYLLHKFFSCGKKRVKSRHKYLSKDYKEVMNVYGPTKAADKGFDPIL